MLRIILLILIGISSIPASAEYTKPEMTELYRAVFYNKIDLVEFYIQNGVDINALASNDITPLHMAAFRGKEASIKMLLKYGADKDLQNTRGETALEIAKEKGFTDIVKLLSPNS